MRGVGGATGRGADVAHVREFSLGSLVGSCGRDLERKEKFQWELSAGIQEREAELCVAEKRR